MNNFLNIIKKLRHDNTTCDYEVFTDKYLDYMNPPFHEISFDNVKIDYSFDKIENTYSNNTIYTDIIDNNTKDGTDNKIDKYNNKINEILKNVNNYSISDCSYYIFSLTRSEYLQILSKKNIIYIINKYKLDEIKTMYIYTQFDETLLPFTEYSNIKLFINKKIEKKSNFYCIFFMLPSKTYSNMPYEIINTIFNAIEMLDIGGSILIHHIYSPYIERQCKLILMYINTFSHVNIIYSKWISSNNSVYFLLQNKQRNFEYWKESYTPYLNIHYNKQIYDIRTKLIQFCFDILAFLKKNTIIDTQLLLLKTTNYKLYLLTKKKILENIINFNYKF
jgi:hypothetical protein